MTKVINIFGAPSAGKTATAHNLTGWMKSKGLNVEFVAEIAKPLAHLDVKLLEDELYLFAAQNHGLYDYLNKVDYIVTDCPIVMTIPYLMYPDRNVKYENNLAWKNTVKELIIMTHYKYDNINFFVERDTKYSSIGRIESSEQSLEVQDSLRDLLDEQRIKYFLTKTSQSFDFCCKRLEASI